EAKKKEQRAHKKKLVEDAKDRYRTAVEVAERAKSAAAKSVAQSPATAAQAVKEAADAQKAVEEADRGRTEAKILADGIVIDDSDERGFIALAFTAGGGLLQFNPSDTAAAAGGGAFGGQGSLTFGFWQVAPAKGLANGVELRALGRFWGTASTAPVFTVEGLVTARYFFSFFGFGVAGDFRYLNFSTLTEAQTRPLLVGVGPSISLTPIDRRDMKLSFNAHWTPLIVSDWLRVTGDIEFSYKAFTISVVGGRASDGPAGAQRSGVYIGAFAGIRAAW
ncbi:MAG: hypothetical protein ACO1OB_22525, partial [Archangium sp.]